jgi:hypothetical protein
MKIRVFAVLALWIFAAGAMPVAAQQQPAAKSLYDRLGGIYPIAALVDDFIDRVFANATINANPNIYKARKEERKAGLKTQGYGHRFSSKEVSLRAPMSSARSSRCSTPRRTSGSIRRPDVAHVEPSKSAARHF